MNLTILSAGVVYLEKQDQIVQDGMLADLVSNTCWAYLFVLLTVSVLVSGGVAALWIWAKS